jgi:hypothetical protein
MLGCIVPLSAQHMSKSLLRFAAASDHPLFTPYVIRCCIFQRIFGVGRHVLINVLHLFKVSFFGKTFGAHLKPFFKGFFTRGLAIEFSSGTRPKFTRFVEFKRSVNTEQINNSPLDLSDFIKFILNIINRFLNFQLRFLFR